MKTTVHEGSIPDNTGRYKIAPNSRSIIPLSALVALICVFAIGGIWVATMQRIVFERAQTITNVIDNNNNLALAFEQQVASTLSQAEQVTAFVRYVYENWPLTLDLNDWSSQRVIRDPAFSSIVVLDADGDTVASNLPVDQDGSYAGRDFFEQQRKSQTDNIYIGKPEQIAASDLWRIPMSLPMHRADGFSGAVVVFVEPTTINSFYDQINLGPRDMIEISGLDGIIRSRRVGDATTFGGEHGYHAWYARQSIKPNGGFIDKGDTTDGSWRIVSYRTMADYPMMITIGVDYASALAITNEQRNNYLLMATLGTVVLLICAGLIVFFAIRQRNDYARIAAHLSHDALHDDLTGLPNRIMFTDRLQRAIEAARRHKKFVTVLYLDLDGFKQVNDTHGHASGDLLLQQVATRIQDCIRARSEDTVSRFGGDEFGITLASLDSPAQAARIARTILVALDKPFVLNDGITGKVSVSIGAATYPLDSSDPDRLLSYADAAMYKAKQAGKNRFHWYQNQPEALMTPEPEPTAVNQAEASQV